MRNRLHSLNRGGGDQHDQYAGHSTNKNDPSKQKLKSKDAAFLDSYLTNRLKPTRKSICEGMVFALERPSSSKLVAARIIETMTEVVTSRDGKQSGGAMANAGHDFNDSLGGLGRLKTLLFLVSDILFNSVQSTEAWS